MAKPFRFGVMTAGGSTAAEVRDKARKVEALGYRSLLYNDHYAGPGPAMEAANHGPQPVASIPAVTVSAEVTSTLVVGFRVLAVDYHNPVVLAKELATIDLLSDGRLEIGLGAGWITSEYEAMGIPMDPPSTRIGRLGEVVDVVRAAMGDGLVDVHGRYGVDASGFEGTPAPVQRPCPPIAIGGGGRKVLELAARRADIVAFNVNNRAGKLGPDGTRESTADATLEKTGWVREAAGDRFEDIELEIGAYFSAVTDDPKGVAEGLSGFFGLDVADVLDHPHALIGSVDAICDQLEERRERYGFSYVTVLDHNAEPFAPVVERMTGK
ncbi:MAG TPA: TIGR03621 family F420-dependent LLM class oxidoreductase [Acidimicrobiales bacterium]|nr:TIGR03621 family F420-dependent LLM class oxidoreductase [Acidimicrobiales bacterium]